MRISFCLVTYKRQDVFQKCLESIYAQDRLPKPYELIIVDNGGDLQIEPPADPSIIFRFERPSTNLGATGGRNLGMRLATGDYFVLMDSDAAWLKSDDVSQLISVMEANPQCGAVYVRTVDSKANVIRSELPVPNKDYALSLSEVTKIPYFYAIGHVLRAEAIRVVGGFPDRFHYGMEEVDLSYRLIEGGYTILYDPRIAIQHFRSDEGRPYTNNKYWEIAALNKMRLSWRLLPQPYPLTTSLVWSLIVLVKTRSIKSFVRVLQQLSEERELLLQERRPINKQAIQYIKMTGGRLLY